MDLIPDFIRRKQGKVPITYEVPALEEILKETYGAIVYQEHVMAIASKAGGFSLGQPDLMLRARGKKKPEEVGNPPSRAIGGQKERNSTDMRADRRAEL